MDGNPLTWDKRSGWFLLLGAVLAVFSLFLWLVQPESAYGKGQKVMSDYSGQTYWFVDPMVDLTAGTPIIVTPTRFNTSSDWDEVAFNRLLTVTGLCRVRVLCEITTAFTGGAASRTISLDVGTAAGALIPATLYSTFGTADRVWYTNAAPTAYGTVATWYKDVLVDDENIGFKIYDTAPTDGAFRFLFWVTPLETADGAAGAVAGSGEAN